jgi:hypothetical protein
VFSFKSSEFTIQGAKALKPAQHNSKHRGLAMTKRDGAEAVNAASPGISIKELATLY